MMFMGGDAKGSIFILLSKAMRGYPFVGFSSSGMGLEIADVESTSARNMGVAISQRPSEDQLNKFHVGLAFAAAGFVGVSSAQTAAAPETLQRVEITGSNIKRIDAETSSPVDVIKRE